MDGKHIRIQAPPNTGSDFYNYKNLFSLVLLGTCDADYCFTTVDIGAKGRQSDGGVFRNSNFGKRFFSKSIDLPLPRKIINDSDVVPYFLVADAAFPFSVNLMRPYPGQFLCQEKRIFNYRLSRARRVIENTFGIMASKWRILERPIIAKLETVEKIVQALVCLHNFLRKLDREKADTFRYSHITNYIDRENEERTIIPGEWRSYHNGLPQAGRIGGNAYARSASDIRDFLAKYFIEKNPIPSQCSK